jgi:adenylate cyclase
MDVFDHTGDSGLADAVRASEIAREAGSTMALVWSWNFMALAEVETGHVDEGFRHLEDSYREALAGGHDFQASNAVFNAGWTATHLGLGRLVQSWVNRTQGAAGGTTDAWLPYIAAVVALNQGKVREALDMTKWGIQRSKDSGHDKFLWRSHVLLAHTLAESLLPDQALAALPAVSTRVEGQDEVYDGAARIRTYLSAGNFDWALAAAKTVRGAMAYLGSPADAVSEAAAIDPVWLRSFVEAMPAHATPAFSPRAAAAHGRLALYEGRVEDAVRDLGIAESTFRDGGFLLDAWHVGRALAQAEARSGETAKAKERLEAIASDAEAAGARLAAKLARDVAKEVGFSIASPDDAPSRARTGQVNTGERMVSVLFADVRGFTEMSGQIAPADMAERIGSLQRWASQEVSRHRGLIDKFAGDAIMATFNVSGESVDHTLQAVKAAIAIIDKAALAGLPVGAGVAVGPAVVGRLAEAANLSVLGEVTNLAARLQAQSPAGEVTMSEEAHRRVRDWLAERQIEPERLELELKGFGAPVVAFRVRGGAVAPAGPP